MKRTLLLIIATVAVFSACQKKTENPAGELFAKIQQLYKQGKYSETLDSIESLRARYPRAIKERQQALRIWQEASLKMAQEDIALTDSALQATQLQMQQEQDIYKRNMLGVKRDSLQARYEAMIGVVRMIRKRMEQTK
ncbi:MAG: hypothetical protein K6C10_10010 [Prevotella sp.]|nr:hypothetical protein [Prevotella sp.]